MIRVLVAACTLVGTVFGAAVPVRADDLQLIKAVVLQRHGVRPPSSTKEITPLAADPWPTWDVPDGQLTSHGRKAAAELGKWEGQLLRSRGLLSAGCAKPGEVFAWANSGYQRTIDTADTLLAAIFPECGLKAGHLNTKEQDPLFTASESEVGRLDQAQARAAVLASAGGSFDNIEKRMAPLMSELQKVLNCCRVELCQESIKKETCTFGERPSALSPVAGRKSVNWTGPIGQASTIAQVLLLEYGNGFPPEQVGWGRASTSDAVIRLSELRKIKYEHQERVPYIAKRGASNILNQILIALRQAPGQNAPVEGGPSLDAKLVLFVGSDTQIAEIGGILNAHWTLRGYLDDETPPGGGLVFELLRDPKTNDKLVRMAFIAQTLDQMRSAAPLSEADPPNYVTVKIPACDGLERDGACPAETFAKIVQSSIDPTAVSPSPYR